MKSSELHYKFLILLVLLVSTMATVVPCPAMTSDVLLPVQGSTLDWIDSHIDNNLIATYKSSSVPAEIMVYNADGTLYQKIPLTNDQMDLDSLEFSNGKIYFSEYNSSEPSYFRNEIVYAFDLLTGKKEVIYETARLQRVTKIAADEDYVVMCGGQNGENLILHTLSTGSDSAIFSSDNWITGLAMDGDRIVWGCERTDGGRGREIHVYTISSGEDYIIPASRSEKTFGTVDISGNRVAWTKGMKESEILITDLLSGETTSIEKMKAYSKPFISGDTLVYIKKPETDYNNTNTGIIRVYNTETGKFGEDVGSYVAGVTDFDNGLVVWHRYSPRSDWISSVSGTIPTPVLTGQENSNNARQKDSPKQTPVEPVSVASAVMAGGLGYGLMKKKR